MTVFLTHTLVFNPLDLRWRSDEKLLNKVRILVQELGSIGVKTIEKQNETKQKWRSYPRYCDTMAIVSILLYIFKPL